jgi:predicted amidophosphoribosyltransferase
VPPPLGLDRWAAALAYEEPASSLVLVLKNGQRRDLVPWLADRAAACLEPGPGAVVTWAPTGGSRRRRRGFDQAELLARAVARRWGAPCRPLLVRGAGPAQAGQTGRDRRRGPAFAVRGRVAVPASVVVVDDVATTGATLAAAARALRAAGAREVRGLVVARSATPTAAGG